MRSDMHSLTVRGSLIALAAGLCFGLAAAIVPPRRAAASETVLPNPNSAPAGVLHDGVLTIALEAKASLWRFSDTRPPMTVEAFSEVGKSPIMPGPFVRVPVGTQLRFTIHNSLDKPLSFIVPGALHGAPDEITQQDSVIVAPERSIRSLSAPRCPATSSIAARSPTA